MRSKGRKTLRRGRHLALLCRRGFRKVKILASFVSEHKLLQEGIHRKFFRDEV